MTPVIVLLSIVGVAAAGLAVRTVFAIRRREALRRAALARLRQLDE